MRIGIACCLRNSSLWVRIPPGSPSSTITIAVMPPIKMTTSIVNNFLKSMITNASRSVRQRTFYRMRFFWYGLLGGYFCFHISFLLRITMNLLQKNHIYLNKVKVDIITIKNLIRRKNEIQII